METQLDDQIVALYSGTEKGMVAVAADLGCSRHRVRSTLKSRGVSLKRQGGDRGHCKNLKTGRHVDQKGYVWVRLRLIPDADGLVKVYNGYVAEHRAVMAVHLGRALLPGESVHHKDGNRSNNDMGNLQLRSSAHGMGAVLCCADCGSQNIIGEAI